MNIENYWRVTLLQQPEKMKTFFDKNAYINWHNTNEHFSVDEFIRANCEYPGQWDGTIEKIVTKDDLIICVVHVFSKDQTISCHVTSFIRIHDDKIISIDEYWGDDGTPPKWRADKHIGSPIK